MVYYLFLFLLFCVQRVDKIGVYLVLHLVYFKFGLISFHGPVVFICMVAISKQRIFSGFWAHLSTSDKIYAEKTFNNYNETHKKQRGS